jgi:Leucine-rich repeat (LRR) protein
VQLNTLPRRFFANLPALTQIYLKADLQTLPEDVFEGSKNISMLKLDQNLLNNLPENLFKDQESLERLYLQDNRIDDLPNNFFVGTKMLRELNLSRNRLTIIKK